MIQQASFMDFFEGLFIILFIFAIGFWITILLAPLVLRFFIKRRMDAMEKQLFQEQSKQENNAQQYYNSSTKGGKQPKEKKIVGEYIDFEEIE
ncbi:MULTISPECIES: DUF4834 family protein [unclassified Capnocytophaga]|jgi:hypothetical protein|uniref:DUF4834 family protein n=1 Tax=unclassified Capnocytophaga TaxID=2640652 RepID=UPI000202B316|nr:MULTISPECIES: DUF4834 family protein [unclassified Capnocytophaga]EGD34069.1 hypothetical protein HMPREF9071_1339 [Capnocytophaga sp. oral taxon 338 str. F0234]MEB3004783.1 DUF4834 family protein [Capnocytophaga sp. G2]